MARRKNTLRTKELRVSTTHVVHSYLQSLVETGLYGKNPAAAAERLIERGLERLIETGVLLRQGAGE